MFKVYKKESDAMMSIAGEGMQIDEGGEFFLLSDACKEVVSHHPNLTWPESADEAPAAAEGAK